MCGKIPDSSVPDKLMKFLTLPGFCSNHKTVHASLQGYTLGVTVIIEGNGLGN